MNLYNVLLKPLITEKGHRLKDEEGKVCFAINLKAGKEDVKKAVQTLFDVKVVAVNTSVLRGKTKRRGAKEYMTPKSKKAFVTLEEGNKIAMFEEQ
jgi:large subunit ribosomal protein L23